MDLVILTFLPSGTLNYGCEDRYAGDGAAACGHRSGARLKYGEAYFDFFCSFGEFTKQSVFIFFFIVGRAIVVGTPVADLKESI
jgi:hypothetical protein